MIYTYQFEQDVLMVEKLSGKEIIYKKHAIKMMAERAITKKQVEIALQRGAKFKQTDGFLVKYTYYSIAYKITDDRYIIKTVYLN